MPALEIGAVVLAFTFLRRIECLAEVESRPDLRGSTAPALADLAAVPDTPGDPLRQYLAALPPRPSRIVQRMGLNDHVDLLSDRVIIPTLSRFFADLDLSPTAVGSQAMGVLFDDLVARWTSQLGREAGEWFTPRDVIELMLALLLEPDAHKLSQPATIYDPVCGTGGALSGAFAQLAALHGDRDLRVVGQDLNPRALAICEAELLLRGADYELRVGDTLVTDRHPSVTFDYALACPPFGVSWKHALEDVKRSPGRFPAGLPAVSDATWLFVQDVIAKMKPRDQGGGRAIVLVHGGALVRGNPESGDARIRRWMFEQDLIDAIVSLPSQVLPHTAIPTYALVLTNNKKREREGRIALVDARDAWGPATRPVGHKRRRLLEDHINDVADAAHVRSGPMVRERTLSDFLVDNEDGGAYAIEPWMFVAGIDDGSHAPLDRYVDRPTPTRAEPDDLLIRSVGEGDVELDEVGDTMRPLMPCGGGDLVGLGARWTVLPEGHPEAYTALDVLRLKAGFADRRHLLMLWLTSPEAQRQLGGGAVPRLGMRIRVPRRLMEDDELARAAEELQVAQTEANGRLAPILETPLQRQRADVASLSTEDLLTHTSRLRALVSILGPMTDPFQRAEWSFPTQVADLAREYRIESEPERRFRTGQLLADALARHLGLLAIACLVSESAQSLPETLEPFQGGISSGSWLHILQQAQNVDSLSRVPALADVSFRKRGVGAYLKEAVEMRNRYAHAHGVLPQAVVAEQLNELEPLLTGSLEGLAWLSDLDIVYVRRCEYTSTHAGFQVHAARLHGAHPTWEPVMFSTVEPVAPDQVVVLSNSEPHPLRLDPFMVVNACSECRREELYILDRAWSDSGRLRSVSVRNHQIDHGVDGGA